MLSILPSILQISHYATLGCIGALSCDAAEILVRAYFAVVSLKLRLPTTVTKLAGVAKVSHQIAIRILSSVRGT